MKMFLLIFSIILGTVCILSTLIALLKTEVWWVRIFDFPRMQILAIGILGLGFYLISGAFNIGGIIFLSILFSSIAYQAARIFPYTSIHNHQVKKSDERKRDREISIYITNVYMDSKHYKRCLDAIYNADPDIILALETNEQWLKELKVLEKKYQYTVYKPLENTYGLLLFSRLELIEPEVKFLIKSDIPSIHTKIKLPSGDLIKFYGLHPKPPAPEESNSSAPRDAELIIVAKDAKKQKLPVVVAGDLNDVAWSHTTHLFQKISGLLDPRVGRGMYSTFNAKYPLFRWPLDHLFHSRDFKLINMERIPHVGSDHFPICVRLSYMPEEKVEHEKPRPSPEDKKEAEEKVEKVKTTNKENV